MSGFLHRCIIVGLIFLSAARIALSQVSDHPSRELYVHVVHVSTLEWLKTEPFQIKMDYQLFDLEGRPATKGTAEEAWGEHGKRVKGVQLIPVSSSTLTVNPLRAGSRENFLLRQVIASIARPFPEAAVADGFGMDQIQREIDGNTVDCFLIHDAKVAYENAYCLNPDNELTGITGDLFTIRRSNFRKFGVHDVPMDIELSYEGRVAMAAHVTELEAVDVLTGTPSSSAPVIPGKVLAGRRLKGKTPSYPKSAKKEHKDGIVMVTAVITKQGTISNMEVVFSPDPALSKAATDAIKKWTYQPYLLNGVPTEVDTTIKVNFNFNPES